MTLPVQVGMLGSSWEALWVQQDRELVRKRGLSSAVVSSELGPRDSKSERRALVEIWVVIHGKGTRRMGSQQPRGACGRV